MNDELDRGERVTRRGVTFVTHWEGFSEDAYWDVDHFSIGYGTQAKSQHEHIDQEEAWRRLRQHLNRAVVPNIPKYRRMKPQERDALASLGFNVGVRILVDPAWSTLARRLESPEGATFAERKDIYREEIPKWIDPGSIYEAGLTKRRAAEVALACDGDYSGRP
jgi:GH24 family phage-related lysozyme (muramidase)